MSFITIYYLSPPSEGSGASCPSERSFSSFKSMSQYVRRTGIKDASVYVNDRLCILIGNRYIPVSSLAEKISSAIILSQINK